MKVREKKSDGLALVVVLVIIVLVTAILVAFTSKSRTSANASSSFSTGISAGLLAQDAAQTIIAGLQREMETNSRVIAPKVWVPKTPQDYLPKIDSDSPLPVLLKTGTSMPGGGGPDWLSQVTTEQKSLNGRFLSRARWNAPALLTPTQAASTGLPLPRWFYLDQNRAAGGLAAGWTKAQFNPVGRYAFRVYDLSGLVDINVAGVPQNVTTSSDGQKSMGRKGSLAWLDLPASGLAGLSGSNYSLFDWRGPTENYGAFVKNFGAPYGFLVSPPASLAAPSGSQSYSMGKVNRLLSRQDLIHATKAQLFNPQFSGDGTDFLTAATVFSREVNAPSTTVINQAGVSAISSDLQNAATPGNDYNPFAPEVLVLAGGFTRRDGSLAKAGEPLVRNRFPLNKLALFGIYRSDTSTAQQKNEALAGIEKYFGLAPNADGTWRYVHGLIHDSSLDPTPQSPARERLRTFAELASGSTGAPYDSGDPTDAAMREPNFFEYLQAGILGDSLGQGTYEGIFNNEPADTSIARHILSIGLNLIDQYDEDNDPTVIRRTSLETLILPGYRESPDPDICGVENLPYVQIIGESCFRRFSDSPFNYKRVRSPAGEYPVYPKIATYYQFQLWNPHRDSVDATGEFRIVASGSPSVFLRIDKGVTPTTDLFAEPAVNFHPASDWISFTTPGTNTFTTPHLLSLNDAGIGVSSPTSQYAFDGARILGFWCGDVDAPYNGFFRPDDGPNPDEKLVHPEIPYSMERYGTGAGASYMRVEKPLGLIFQLQKKDASGNWLPVQTIPLSRTVNHVLSNMFTDNPTVTATNRKFSVNFHQVPFFYVHFAWSDPRSMRFGGGFSQHYAGESLAVANTFLPLDNHFTPSASAFWINTNFGSAFELAGGLTRYYRPARLSANTPGGSYYRDRGQTGPRLGDTAVAGSGLEVYSGTASRPIVLNRPFQSVAEMGYAFRDLPWKTVNFSQDVASAGKSPADAALLDLFSLNDTAVRAGVINLNAASRETLEALLKGTALQPGTSSPDPAVLSNSEAASVASGLRTALGNRTSPNRVIRTAADLPAILQGVAIMSGWPKPKREAAIAALADVHNGRTWNLLIDVVAQTGQFPRDDGNRAAFQVTGEQHLLVQVAIDRITGEIVDQQTEVAAE